MTRARRLRTGGRGQCQCARNAPRFTLPYLLVTRHLPISPSKLALAPALETGAHDRNRTGDLVLTKDVLYRLSYVGLRQTSLTAPLPDLEWSG